MSEIKTYTIRLLIDSQFEQVRLLGSAVRGIGQELNLPTEQVSQLELILVEAVNNVIEHAYELQPGRDIKVRVECEPASQIKIIISDNGLSLPVNKIDSHQPNTANFPEPESLPEGGWGLGLIKLLADSLHYEQDHRGNHLHVCKQLA